MGGGKDSRTAGEKVNGKHRNKRVGEREVGVKGDGRNPVLVLFCCTNLSHCSCFFLHSYYIKLFFLKDY